MRKITLDELKKIPGEGLIIQGCCGDLQEWADGINTMLTEAGILKDSDSFRDISVFECDGHTDILFGMDDVNLNIGALAMWRLQTYSQFGGTWLSDFKENRLGEKAEQEQEDTASRKPDCPLIGADGNIFNLMGIAGRTLRENGMPKEAKEMCSRVMSSGSYDSALGIIGEYVNITSADDYEIEEEEEMGEIEL